MATKELTTCPCCGANGRQITICKQSHHQCPNPLCAIYNTPIFSMFWAVTVPKVKVKKRKDFGALNIAQVVGYERW